MNWWRGDRRTCKKIGGAGKYRQPRIWTLCKSLLNSGRWCPHSRARLYYRSAVSAGCFISLLLFDCSMVVPVCAYNFRCCVEGLLSAKFRVHCEFFFFCYLLFLSFLLLLLPSPYTSLSATYYLWILLTAIFVQVIRKIPDPALAITQPRTVPARLVWSSGSFPKPNSEQNSGENSESWTRTRVSEGIFNVKQGTHACQTQGSAREHRQVVHCCLLRLTAYDQSCHCLLRYSKRFNVIQSWVKTVVFWIGLNGWSEPIEFNLLSCPFLISLFIFFFKAFWVYRTNYTNRNKHRNTAP